MPLKRFCKVTGLLAVTLADETALYQPRNKRFALNEYRCTALELRCRFNHSCIVFTPPLQLHISCCCVLHVLATATTRPPAYAVMHVELNPVYPDIGDPIEFISATRQAPTRAGLPPCIESRQHRRTHFTHTVGTSGNGTTHRRAKRILQHCLTSTAEVLGM